MPGTSAGVISGKGQVTATTTNTLNLTGANTYSGGTAIGSATLLANNKSGLGHRHRPCDGQFQRDARRQRDDFRPDHAE